MEPHSLLYLREAPLRVIGYHAVVESLHESLKLGNNDVLVIARITNQRSCGSLRVPLQPMCPAVDLRRTGERFAEDEVLSIVLIHVGLVVRPSSVEVVEIELWCPEVHQRVRIVLLLQAARWIKGKIVVDELAEVGEGGRDTTFFAVGSVFGIRGISHRDHCLCELFQGSQGFRVGIAEVSWR